MRNTETMARGELTQRARAKPAGVFGIVGHFPEDGRLHDVAPIPRVRSGNNEVSPRFQVCPTCGEKSVVVAKMLNYVPGYDHVEPSADVESGGVRPEHAVSHAPKHGNLFLEDVDANEFGCYGVDRSVQPVGAAEAVSAVLDAADVEHRLPAAGFGDVGELRIGPRHLHCDSIKHARARGM